MNDRRASFAHSSVIAPSVPILAGATFDPRSVPIVGVDDSLPKVPWQALQPQALRERFLQPPTWQPEVLREQRFTDRVPALAAVLVPIVMREQPMVLLTERTANLSTHSGQVAFPGGRVDPEDRDVRDTALREAHEEVGLRSGAVELLGELPTYVTGTAFVVTPVVGLVQPALQLTPNPGEVARVFEVPLSFLMDPAHHRRHVVDWQGKRRQWFSMPYDDGEHEHFIWGATAGMLRNLYRFLVA